MSGPALMLRRPAPRQTPYEHLRLARDPLQRPVLACAPPANAPWPDVHFNVSHDGHYTVLAADERRPIGVDIVHVAWPTGVSTLDGFFGTLRGALAPAEWQAVAAQATDHDRLACFYRHWALKESFLKALGVGLSVPNLCDIEFADVPAGRLGRASPTVRWQGIVRTDWHFAVHHLGADDHLVAVAVRCDASDSESTVQALLRQPFRRLTLEELLDGSAPYAAAPASADELAELWRRYAESAEHAQVP